MIPLNPLVMPLLLTNYHLLLSEVKYFCCGSWRWRGLKVMAFIQIFKIPAKQFSSPAVSLRASELPQKEKIFIKGKQRSVRAAYSAVIGHFLFHSRARCR